MLIIFIVWLSLLNNSLARLDDRGEGFWQKITAGLKGEFEAISNSFERARSLFDESGDYPESELEKEVFPKIK